MSSSEGRKLVHWVGRCRDSGHASDRDVDIARQILSDARDRECGQARVEVRELGRHKRFTESERNRIPALHQQVERCVGAKRLPRIVLAEVIDLINRLQKR